jgi:hypothetical protein
MSAAAAFPVTRLVMSVTGKHQMMSVSGPCRRRHVGEPYAFREPHAALLQRLLESLRIGQMLVADAVALRTDGDVRFSRGKHGATPQR